MRTPTLKLLPFLLCLLFLLPACGSHNTATDFADSKEISRFPVEHTLNPDSGKAVDIDVYGIMEFKTEDSLMIVSSSMGENSWYIYRLPACDSVMAMLRQGGGPMEVDFNVPTTFATFNRDSNGHVIASIPQTQTRKLIKIDLTASADSTRLIGDVKTSFDFSPFTILSRDLTVDRYLRVDVDPENLTVTRKLLDHGKEVPVKAFDVLNKKTVKDMSEIGKLVPIMAIKPNSDRIAEVVVDSPVINIYTLDGEVALSIIGNFEGMPTTNEVTEEQILTQYYKNINSYPDFFTVLQPVYDSDNKEVANNLLFFNWEGTPLQKVTIPTSGIRNTDIDLLNSTLYVLYGEEDQLRAFPLTLPTTPA